MKPRTLFRIFSTLVSPPSSDVHAVSAAVASAAAVNVAVDARDVTRKVETRRVKDAMVWLDELGQAGASQMLAVRWP